MKNSNTPFKKMNKIRKTLSNHIGRGATVYNYKSEILVNRYEQAAQELKEAGLWNDWCVNEIHRSPEHDAWDLFA